MTGLEWLTDEIATGLTFSILTTLYLIIGLGCSRLIARANKMPFSIFHIVVWPISLSICAVTDGEIN